jgi:CRISPR/Cas system-associated exonuclease Cas4 (RecB family)
LITVHQSTLVDYEKCPYLCFKNWGRVGEPDPVREENELTNKYAMCGTALHEVLDDWAKATKGGAKFPLVNAKELLQDKIEAIPLSQFDDELDKESWKANMDEQLEWIWGIYCTKPPLYSELEFRIENLIPEMLPVAGTIDRIDGNLQTRKINLMDYKTGKQYTKKELLSNIQATLYSLAFEKMFGFLPENFIFIFSKTKREKVIPITQDFLDRGLERIKGIWFKIMSNDFAPPHKANKFFCQNFCEVGMNNCPKWNKAKPRGWQGVDRL